MNENINYNLSIDKLNVNSKINVLIIDESPVISKMTSMIIKKYGYKTSYELSGEMSIKKIKDNWNNKNNQYDIIILDIHMSDMDEFSVAKKN